MNSEVQEKLQGQDIVKAIKIQRLRLHGHMRRMGEEKVVRKVTEWKSDWKSKKKTEKLIGGTGIRGHKKAKNPQLKSEGSRSEVIEENHKKGKDEQGTKEMEMRTKENVK